MSYHIIILWLFIISFIYTQESDSFNLDQPQEDDSMIGDTTSLMIDSLNHNEELNIKVGRGGAGTRELIVNLHANDRKRMKISSQRLKEYEVYIMNQTMNFTVIRCQNYKDMYTLIYNICNESSLCKEAFHLDNIKHNQQQQSQSTSNIYNNNFKRFIYQLSLTQLFIIHDHNNGASGASNDKATAASDESEFLLDQQILSKQQQSNIFFWEDNLPPQWIPRYIIELNNTYTDTCVNTFNIYSTDNSNFIHSTLYLLHVFKTYVVNDYQCSDFNERLILDVNNQPECICAYGKSCDNESNTTILIIIIVVLFLVLLVLYIIATFWSNKRIIDAIYHVSMHNKSKQL